ncbi:MAG: GNAT family N-acetyltransferase [Synergistaceae bacterium]|jgi:RimJ/RimL family protein N-acetyltransferase|nr:GNAT family N-acetyltransferase [Synergistaceae bacterium]
MAAWDGAWSEEDNLAGLQKQLNHYAEHGFGRWAVVLKETNVVIGICGLQYCETDRENVPEIGYLFNRRYWRKGYATEAAVAVREYAFRVPGFSEVFSLVRDTNLASMNVAIRSGMTVRGRFVKHYKGADMPHYVFSVRRDGRGDPNTGVKYAIVDVPADSMKSTCPTPPSSAVPPKTCFSS